MKGVLGVFRSYSFKTLQEAGYIGYFQFYMKSRFAQVHKEEIYFERSIIRYMKEEFIEIAFCLDHVMYPSGGNSATCAELEELLKDEEALNKTEFYQNGEKVDKKEVLDFLEKNFFDYSIEIQPLPLFQVCQLPEEIYY